jgi:hypothetical protein
VLNFTFVAVPDAPILHSGRLIAGKRDGKAVGGRPAGACEATGPGSRRLFPGPHEAGHIIAQQEVAAAVPAGWLAHRQTAHGILGVETLGAPSLATRLQREISESIHQIKSRKEKLSRKSRSHAGRITRLKRATTHAGSLYRQTEKTRTPTEIKRRTLTLRNEPTVPKQSEERSKGKKKTEYVHVNSNLSMGKDKCRFIFRGYKLPSLDYEWEDGQLSLSNQS